MGIGGGVTGFFQWARQLRGEISALEDERASELGCLPASPEEAGGQIGRVN